MKHVSKLPKQSLTVRQATQELREKLTQTESASTLLARGFLESNHPLEAALAFFAKKQIRVALQVICILEDDVTGPKISSLKEGGEK